MSDRRVLPQIALISVLTCVLAMNADGQTKSQTKLTQSAGQGSYALRLPANTKAPPARIYRTESLSKIPMPTADWWSSLAWHQPSFCQFPHPLAIQSTAAGLRIAYSGNAMVATKKAIMVGMPVGTNDDLIIGVEGVDSFAQANVNQFSDWFVQMKYERDQAFLTTTIGHGSPFVFARYQHAKPTVKFIRQPTVWSGDEKSSMLGVTLGRNHYGLFAPKGSTWSGWNTATRTLLSKQDFFSVAILPDNRPETLQWFAKFAHQHMTHSQVEWKMDWSTRQAITEFHVKVESLESDTNQPSDQSGQTVMALYPHQWRGQKIDESHGVYHSARGLMKIIAAGHFTTRVDCPPLLPYLPAPQEGVDDLQKLLTIDVQKLLTEPIANDSYWGGKQVNKAASLLHIADQLDDVDAGNRLTSFIRERLEDWLTADISEVEKGDGHCFYYDSNWGTLIGYPASYLSDEKLNDHHFHYGYLLRAAAELALRDPEWAGEKQFGPMLQEVIENIACADRSNPRYPWLRCFDPYAGHSWAAGDAGYHDGNNQESSSESINAWFALALLGEAQGNTALRDLGAWLLANEVHSVREYWFDESSENFPSEFSTGAAGIVWGGKTDHATWFSDHAEMIHGINWLPMHGGALHLGLPADLANRQYDRLIKNNGTDQWRDWGNLVLMYRALHDPADALKQFRALGDKLPKESGITDSETAYWLLSLNELGAIQQSPPGSAPFSATFKPLSGNSVHVELKDGELRLKTAK
jgi:endoglucanase Acf2